MAAPRRTTDNELVNTAFTAMIRDPATQQWTVGAAAQKPSLYHSNSLLLPDATALTAGGGSPGHLVSGRRALRAHGTRPRRGALIVWARTQDPATHRFTTNGAGSVPKKAFVHDTVPVTVFCTQRVSAP